MAMKNPFPSPECDKTELGPDLKGYIDWEFKAYRVDDVYS